MGENEIDMEDMELPKIQTEERGWVLPEKAKSIKAETVLNENGQRLGEIHEFSVSVEPGSKEAVLTITLPNINSKNSVVLTSGWHTWSGVDNPTFGESVGMQTIEKRTEGGKRESIIEPGDATEVVPKGEGKSYGFVDFRKSTPQGTQETFVGLVPGLKDLENISFTEDESGNMQVTLRKNLEGTATTEVDFKLFLSDESYGDALKGYAGELKKLVGDVQPYVDKAMWFSWASYGKFVTETNIRNELAAIKESPDLKKEIGCLMIDDGWEKILGQWDVDPKKFPDMVGLIKEIKASGIDAGVWLSPFMLDKASEVFQKHPDWVVKNKDGSPLEVPVPQFLPTDKVLPISRKPYVLDISNEGAREYLYGKLEELSKMGFEVFKLDYLSVVFIGELANKNKTSVEYYREFFEEARKRMNIHAEKPIQMVACGGPMLESIGLFEGIRVSNDSAAQPINRLIDKFVKSNAMYTDAVRTSFRRALPFGEALGLMFDGVHLNDPRVNIPKDLKDRYMKALPALRNLGVPNLFIGDSMLRVGSAGRVEWTNFLRNFKKGQIINPPQTK